jgi:hypothetical protein
VARAAGKRERTRRLNPGEHHRMSRFNPRAIVIAMLLSLALDVFGGVILVAGFSNGLRDGMSPDELEAAIQLVLQNTGFLMASLTYGVATTAFGGYLAARLAGRYPYFNALAIGVIGILIGLLLNNQSPSWYDALAYLLSIPAALFGARTFTAKRAS